MADDALLFDGSQGPLGLETCSTADTVLPSAKSKKRDSDSEEEEENVDLLLLREVVLGVDAACRLESLSGFVEAVNAAFERSPGLVADFYHELDLGSSWSNNNQAAWVTRRNLVDFWLAESTELRGKLARSWDLPRSDPELAWRTRLGLDLLGSRHLVTERSLLLSYAERVQWEQIRRGTQGAFNIERHEEEIARFSWDDLGDLAKETWTPEVGSGRGRVRYRRRGVLHLPFSPKEEGHKTTVKTSKRVKNVELFQLPLRFVPEPLDAVDASKRSKRLAAWRDDRAFGQPRLAQLLHDVVVLFAPTETLWRVRACSRCSAARVAQLFEKEGVVFRAPARPLRDPMRWVSALERVFPNVKSVDLRGTGVNLQAPVLSFDEFEGLKHVAVAANAYLIKNLDEAFGTKRSKGGRKRSKGRNLETLLLVQQQHEGIPTRNSPPADTLLTVAENFSKSLQSLRFFVNTENDGGPTSGPRKNAHFTSQDVRALAGLHKLRHLRIDALSQADCTSKLLEPTRLSTPCVRIRRALAVGDPSLEAWTAFFKGTAQNLELLTFVDVEPHGLVALDDDDGDEQQSSELPELYRNFRENGPDPFAALAKTLYEAREQAYNEEGSSHHKAATVRFYRPTSYYVPSSSSSSSDPAQPPPTNRAGGSSSNPRPGVVDVLALKGAIVRRKVTWRVEELAPAGAALAKALGSSSGTTTATTTTTTTTATTTTPAGDDLLRVLRHSLPRVPQEPNDLTDLG